MKVTDILSLNSLLLLAALFFAAVYTFVYSKKSADKASSESNTILRGLIDDQKQEINKMRERIHDLVSELTAVKLNIQILTDRRDYLESLVTSALREHFLTEPGLAETASKLVGKTVTKQRTAMEKRTQPTKS